MKFAHFFVDRPIFAAVLSVLLLIAGGLSLVQLPLSEYPAVAPPTVVVRAAYPGANPRVIAETVAAPLEQEINGVEGMLYMSSQSTSDGRVSLTVTFAQGVDADLAQVQVQNRVARALPRLPQEVQRLGVMTEKTSTDILMVVHLVSPDSSLEPLYLSNYAVLQVKDVLQRIPGVGSVVVWGAGEYSMRIWLDPQKLASRHLTASDAVAAIREQNVQVAAGVVGQQPDASSAFQVTVTTQGRLVDEEQFRDIVLKVGEGGQVTRLRDVARVELGASSYGLKALLDGKPAVAIGINQASGSNALEVSAAVRERVAELSKAFPKGMEYRVAYDPTFFVRASIKNVVSTLLEAVVLVVLVVVLFLQTWRASIIPLAAVPVSLVGTAAVMHLLGFSLNTLSLFGLVLSIGIVVDDAIVVVENVERHIALGASPKEAARRAMTEVTGPIIAITSVLAAVFIPTAFMGGLTGQFYRQFALTIAISTLLSAFNSLTLSPALAGVLLRPHHGKKDGLTRFMDWGLGRWLFGPFNRFFERASNGYVSAVKRVVRISAVAFLVYGGLLVLTWAGFNHVPKGFVPMQDKYYLVGIAQLPPASSLDRTTEVVRRMSEMALEEKGVANVIAFSGLSVNGFVNAPNAAVVFTALDTFENRKSPELSAGAIAARLQKKFSTIPDGFAAIFPPPPVPGMGALAGFKLQLEDRAGLGPEALYEAAQALAQRASREPEVAGLMSGFEINVPQLQLDVDRVKAKTQGVPLGDIFDTLQIHLGSLYVNDFNRFGRTYQVNVQADAPYRMQAEDIGRLQVRNAQGSMVPLASLVNVKPSFGPDQVMRYNGYPSADINGMARPGVSTGEAVAAMERLAAETLPAGMSFEWTDLTYQEKLAGKEGLLVFPLAILLAFLILAAQYNSWTLPLAVLLTVPMALLSAIAGVWLTGGENNIFTQIGLVVLIGLAAKNAILIVEFARAQEDEGMGVVQAALEACRLRLRPILMTSVAFIMGVVPLATATGAGSEMRQAMGVAVLAGMLGVTLFGLVLTPIFYIAIRKLELRRAAPAPEPEPLPPGATGAPGH
ncbi:efflux RND transporter permease subunit [Pyxidicoccus parkwayensis]|uniref:Efflux RND transporter permease subunit n=1 Tax=Pyxidicoccus parkwayensis TaxID=2813578 RepID=A0ABX7NNW6_9BACT|nr:efflux RND transporter permease subunit [Pyxidicoccus parkwaysis]QSQ20465.1 efflux RND transporter permease subunit [Pyxidicoccus parkwaysis]